MTLQSPAATDFRALSLQVREAGHLDRRLFYYWPKILLTLAVFAAGWVALFVLGSTWATIGIAIFLGIMSTQLGFLGHDAGHGQIFASRRANRLLGLVIGNGLIGLSFGWWVPKHSAHHAHPNQSGLDPDIGVGLVDVSGVRENSDGHSRLAVFMSRRQAALFLPLMLLRSTGLYVAGVQDLLRPNDRARIGESLLLLFRTAVYLFAVLWVLPLPQAALFIVVQEAVFSLYLGLSFAPNHKGMPLIAEEAQMSFARRQVITARNLTGGRWTTLIFGGLNYQIEHHLFPTMPRPSLRRAQQLVRAFCVENHYGYREESAVRSYLEAIEALRVVRPFVPAPVGV